MAREVKDNSLKDKLDELKEKVPIPEIMEGELLPYLKDNYWTDGLAEMTYNNVCLCPLHVEDTASFRYYPHTNTCNCFAGCGGGDAVWLFREFNKQKLGRNISFRDAVNYLYERYIQNRVVNRVVFDTGKIEKQLSTEQEKFEFVLAMAENESSIEAITKREHEESLVDYYYLEDTLNRLVKANKIKATDATATLKGEVVKIRSRYSS